MVREKEGRTFNCFKYKAKKIIQQELLFVVFVFFFLFFDTFEEVQA